MSEKQPLLVIHTFKKKHLGGSFYRYNTDLIKSVNSLILVALPISSCLTFCRCCSAPDVSLKDASWKVEHRYWCWNLDSAEE